MASASYSPHLLPFPSTQKPRTIFSCTACNSKVFPYHGAFRDCSAAKLQSVIKAKAAPSNRNTKPNSVICGDCDGNGAVVCSQCKGSGVNPVDFFNGQFKAGDSCGFAGAERRCYVEIAMVLASLGGLRALMMSRVPPHSKS